MTQWLDLVRGLAPLNRELRADRNQAGKKPKEGGNDALLHVRCSTIG